jgi:pimeloyl-ACP methyl ester carboxylesterase
MSAELQEGELANATGAMKEIEGARRGAGHLGAATLRRINVPTCCVFGEDGAHGWYRRTTKYVAQNLPRGRLQSIPGASHAAFLDQPLAFAAIVTEAADSAG